jgi:RNA polymerase sigma-70 factor (ECF subfamily)
MPIAGRSPNLKDDFNIFDLLDLKEDSIEDIMVSKQIMDDVRLLVDELPEEQMEVVRMRYFLQMSFKDIADNTGVSINTSLGRMRYALINLRKLIEDKKLILTNS